LGFSIVIGFAVSIIGSSAEGVPVEFAHWDEELTGVVGVGFGMRGFFMIIGGLVRFVWAVGAIRYRGALVIATRLLRSA